MVVIYLIRANVGAHIFKNVFKVSKNDKEQLSMD